MTASPKLPPASRQTSRKQPTTGPAGAVRTRRLAGKDGGSGPRRPRGARQAPPAATPLAGLQADLGSLRTALDEVLARVRSRLVARLERLEQVATGEPSLAASVVEDMRDEIKRAGINPKKGRMKDLARLKGLLDALCGELPGGAR